MNSQHSSSVAFKRFAKTTTADITKIREDRHEQATKTATKWAVNVFEGKRSGLLKSGMRSAEPFLIL